MSDPMAPTCQPNYPNDIPPQQIEDLIDGAASLQRQILRRYTQSVLEEMRYHLWIAQEKCKMFENQCRELRAETLTPREIELIDGMIEVQLHHAERCDSIPNRGMADKQKGWDMERVSLLRKLKASHGIKGDA